MKPSSIIDEKQAAEDKLPGKSAGKAASELTPTVITGMKPGDELGDLRTPGLRVRCGTTGRKVFFYRYKAPGGQMRQIKLGEFPPTGAMTLAAARKALAEAKTAREKGVDLQAAKRTAKAEAKVEREKQRVAEYTVGRMIDDYLAGHVVPMRKAKGAAEVTRFLMSDDLKVIRKRPAVDVTRKEAFALVAGIRDRGVSVLAGQIKTELKAAYEYAMNSGALDMPGNPFAFQLKGLVAAKRERTLTNAELVALVPWMRREYSETVADALLLTLYCGVRSGEACAIEAHEVDETPDGMTWTIPAAKSKTKVSFNVMVPAQAAAILRKRLAMHPTGWLFPARAKGKHIEQKILGVEVWAHSPSCKHKSHAAKPKCPVGGWAPHDLRRTCRTMLSRRGCPLEVAEAILNHTKGGVRANYDHYKFDAEKRLWLQRWADHLDALIGADNVVPMIKGKAYPPAVERVDLPGDLPQDDLGGRYA